MRRHTSQEVIKVGGINDTRLAAAEQRFRKVLTGVYLALQAASLSMFRKPLYKLLVTNPEAVAKLVLEYSMGEEDTAKVILRAMLHGLVDDKLLDEAVNALLMKDGMRFLTVLKKAQRN